MVLAIIQPAFLFASTLQTLEARAEKKHLAAHPYWLRLLHYRHNLLGIYQSEIDDPTFFLSPQGRRDAQAELKATLKAFVQSSPELDEQPPQCRYPARYAWLKEELRFSSDEVREPPCPRYEKWKSQMNPTSISLVFASYYMNNPASMYGHTFLRLNAKGHSADEQLLDYVVNFAADLEGDNGFLFALKGLMGGYHGRFSTFPYYMKVQEYSNLESRDLWEYDLNVTPAQLERLLQHLWELGNVRIRYFFLNKNCSYYLLPVLDVMDPSRSFERPFVFKAIPVDTLREVIQSPGMLHERFYRPSHATKLLAEEKKLTPAEIHMAERLAKNPKRVAQADLATFQPPRRALLLDSAYDLFRYKVGFHRDLTKAAEDKEQEILLLRNHVGAEPPPLKIWPPVPPDHGHPTGRIGLSYGFSNRSRFEELSLRPAIHDVDDPPEGYLPGSQLEMFNTRLRYDDNRRTLYLQEFSLVDLMSLTPWDRWVHPPSWRVNTGLRVDNDLNRDPENSLVYGLNLGTGYASWAPGTDKVLLYGMGEMVFELGHPFTNDIRFGGGPAGGILFWPVTWWRAQFQASYSPYAAGGTSATTKFSLHQSVSLTKTMDLRATLERQNAYKEVLFTWVYFL